MFAYVIPGADVSNVLSDVRVARLLPAGPWQAQFHNDGALITPKVAKPQRLSAFGAPRPTYDGLLYFPPKSLPDLNTLLSPRVAARQDATVVQIVREENLIELRIIPAYAAPRKLLEDNTLGGHGSTYGAAARSLLDELAERQDMPYGEYVAKLGEVCRKAIMHSYPKATRELITDFGLLDEDSMNAIWEGVLHVPKDTSAPGSA